MTCQLGHAIGSATRSDNGDLAKLRSSLAIHMTAPETASVEAPA